MNCYQLDPTEDPRWSGLVEKHPRASVFHTAAWLRALRQTYGYEPMVFTTSPPGAELENGLVFCRVSSRLTGNRLVSLPFSDHCEPLCDSTEELDLLVRYSQTALEDQNCKYVEMRPVHPDLSLTNGAGGFLPAGRYFLHTLSLRSTVDDLFRGFDKDCVQRRIRRAERAGLLEKCGRSYDLLHDFYALYVATRRRHHLPPVPCVWFRNLVRFLGKALEIRVAYTDKTPVAAILTLRFKDVVYYKYGCSDLRFKQFGATPLLLWHAITAAKASGANEFDMGRTQDNNAGLVTFKNHWAPQPMPLVYWRFPKGPSFDLAEGWKLKTARWIFSCMPNRLLTITGKLIYRHIG